MTRDETTMLTRKILESWPDCRIPAATWAEELADLDAGTVGTALVRMRRELDKPPTIATLHNYCRALHTPANTPAGYCENCQNTGWEEATRPQDDTTSVRPCRQCPRGQQMHATHAAILHANGHQRRGAA